MAFHYRVVLPPLAVAVHPAPSPKKVEKKDDHVKKDDEPKAAVEADKKPADKQGATPVSGKAGDTSPAPPAGASPGRPVETPGHVAPSPLPPHVRVPPTPPSPGSMIPEPGTPGTNDTPAPPTPAPVPAEEYIAQVPPPQLDLKSAKVDKADDRGESATHDEQPSPAPPLRLVGPVPPRPIRTKLDLNPAMPYPPIQTDQRGAYFKYAKFIQGEWILIDVTEDGWLAEQWREKPEREALARLRGESEKMVQREAEAIKKRAEVRQLPETADAILLELWNDLVEAVNHEFMAEEFWSRYDWSTPAAQKQLQPARRPASKDDGPSSSDDDVNAAGDGSTPSDLDGIEWTKEGLEEILATVGVQCSYNTAKPLPRSWLHPAGAYLILGHGFFMLRTEDILQWKPEESAEKFEILVTSGHDRVFGSMVMAQKAEERKKKEREYRERKLAERRKADEKARRKRKLEAADKEPKDGEKKDGHSAKEKMVDAAAPATVDSKAKTEDSQNVIGANDAGAIVVKGDKTVMAIPVKAIDHAAKDPKVQHEAETLAAAPGAATRPEAAAEAKGAAQAEVDTAAARDHPGHGKDRPDDAAKDKPKDAAAVAKDGKDKDKDAKRPFDPMREAELLAKMVASGQAPPGVAMEDIKMAFKALEAAVGASTSASNDKKDAQPVIWSWYDSCERWRWRNYEAGLHLIGPGGWEERDWKVFADDRGCEDFDLEETWAEEDERDIHDWSV